MTTYTYTLRRSSDIVQHDLIHIILGVFLLWYFSTYFYFIPPLLPTVAPALETAATPAELGRVRAELGCARISCLQPFIGR